MNTPAPASPPPPPPPPRVYRVHKRKRPALPHPANTAQAAAGSRCVTRDPETSRPLVAPLLARPRRLRRRRRDRPSPGWRLGGPLPVAVVLNAALARFAQERSSP
jgi:hypothetical protein